MTMSNMGVGKDLQNVSDRKKIIYLEPFDSERFALYFHKCPHPVQVFTLSHFEFIDTVY